MMYRLRFTTRGYAAPYPAHVVHSFIRMDMMQHRYQDEVKVAVYVEQMSTPKPVDVYKVIGWACLGLGLLMAFWVA